MQADQQNKAASIDSTTDAIDTGKRVFANNYGPAKLAIKSAQGVRVVDEEGRDYIDLGTGISVTSFGHCNRQIADAIRAQLDQVWHTSNLYYNEPSLALAAELTDSCFAERVFFCNSGAEANEAAIKTVRKAASATRPPERRTIMTFEGCFHGRTLAAVTATAQPKYHEGFEPLPAGFKYVPFNDLSAVKAQFDDSVCAIMLEPIQGEGGIVPVAPGFLQGLRELCDANDAWLVLDEVQSGMGRTGKLWAYQWEDNFEPDAMTSAKALGGGLPIGALMLGKRLADTLQPGSHGSTFGGNLLSCAAARVALELAQQPDLMANVVEQGQRLSEGVSSIASEFGVFQEVRGKGLMIGVQLNETGTEKIGPLVDACRDNGVLVLSAGSGVLRLLPPLVIERDDVDTALERIHNGFSQVFS